MNRHAKCDAASFILGGEIRIRTHTHARTNKQTVDDISTPCQSACVDNKTLLTDDLIACDACLMVNKVTQALINLKPVRIKCGGGATVWPSHLCRNHRPSTLGSAVGTTGDLTGFNILKRAAAHDKIHDALLLFYLQITFQQLAPYVYLLYVCY